MKTQNPFTGRSSGSLANVTASTYLGDNILKSKPLEVRNPKTEKQQNIRRLLGSAGTLAKYLSAINGISKRSARTGRVTNKTARTALVAAILAQKTGTSGNYALSGNGITLQGSGMSHTIPASIVISASGSTSVVTWPSALPVGGSNSDEVAVVIMNLTKKIATVSENLVSRHALTLNPDFVAGSVSVGDKLAVWLTFDSADGMNYDTVISKEVTVVA